MRREMENVWEVVTSVQPSSPSASIYRLTAWYQVLSEKQCSEAHGQWCWGSKLQDSSSAGGPPNLTRRPEFSC